MVSDNRPAVSVIIPTWNRAERLERLLDDLINQDACGLEYEVLIVDNGSTDATPRVAAAAASSSTRVRYFLEPRRGPSYARNRGMAEARAPILAFLDDDVRATRGWVHAVWRAFEDDPTVHCIGGRVEPRWPEPPPSWLTSKHWGPLALQAGRGNAPYLDIDHASSCLISANFACRAEVLAEVGGFSPAYPRDEDRELNLRLWRAGKRGKYVDAVVAAAEVQPERLRKRYHRWWHAVTGASHARMRYRDVIDRDGRLRNPAPDNGLRIRGAPGYLYRELARHLFDGIVLAARGRFDDAFFEECKVRYLIAYLTTRWSTSLRARRATAAAAGATAESEGPCPRATSPS